MRDRNTTISVAEIVDTFGQKLANRLGFAEVAKSGVGEIVQYRFSRGAAALQADATLHIASIEAATGSIARRYVGVTAQIGERRYEFIATRQHTGELLFAEVV